MCFRGAYRPHPRNSKTRAPRAVLAAHPIHPAVPETTALNPLPHVRPTRGPARHPAFQYPLPLAGEGGRPQAAG
jgi:hypothetical protein